MILEIFIMLVLVLANGFFALAEMAVVSSRKARLRHEAELGKKAYSLVLQTAENPSRFLSTIQIVITLVGTLTGAVGGAKVAKGLEASLAVIPGIDGFAETLALVIVVVATTFVSVVLGELVPKNLALSRPETIAAAVIHPLRAFALLFSPLARLLSSTTDLIVGLFGIHAHPEPAVTEDEVKVLIAQGAEAGVFEDREREMVEGVLSMGDRRVTSIMTPRMELAAIDIENGLDAARTLILEHSDFAYLPVVEGDLDHVLGLLPVKEALSSIVRGSFADPRRSMKNPVMVPETMSVLKAFSAIKESGVKTALILDEYGGVAGLVTLADIMESVVGSLPSTGAADEPEMTLRDDGSWLVDGALSIEAFVDVLGIEELPAESDFETVAGLVLEIVGAIPRPGDRCQWQDCEFEVIDMDGLRIDKLLVKRQPAQPSSPES